MPAASSSAAAARRSSTRNSGTGPVVKCGWSVSGLSKDLELGGVLQLAPGKAGCDLDQGHADHVAEESERLGVAVRFYPPPRQRPERARHDRTAEPPRLREAESLGPIKRALRSPFQLTTHLRFRCRWRTS